MYCTVLHCIVLYCTLLHCIALYYIVYFTVLYCTVLHSIIKDNTALMELHNMLVCCATSNVRTVLSPDMATISSLNIIRIDLSSDVTAERYLGRGGGERKGER